MADNDANGIYGRRLFFATCDIEKWRYDKDSPYRLSQWRFDSENVSMPNLAGPGAVITYAAKSYQADFDKYHNYGLQQRLALVCRFVDDITTSIAEMTVRLIRERHSIKVFDRFFSAEDAWVLQIA